MNSTFRSPRQGNNRPLQTWDVNSPDQDHFEEDSQEPTGRAISPKELEELRRQKLHGERVDVHTKKRLEVLANIGRIHKEFEIEGIRFNLRTLKSKESSDVMHSMLKEYTNDLLARNEIRRQSLAYSIAEIDGQPVGSLLEKDDHFNRLEMIDEMDENIVELLYSYFQELNKDALGKYSVKTEEGLQEVVKDLKK